jgi:chromosome partitioning protein
MLTIVVNSQKGGSGKSTLCRILGVHLAHASKQVFLIDLDKQGTLREWHESREHEEPKRVELTAETLAAGLPMLQDHQAEFVFIDTPPHAGETLGDVFRLADLVLIPVKPTPDDLKAAGATVSVLKAIGVPFLFVINQAVQNANITAQAIAALSHHGPVCETMIINRVAYPAAFTDGRTPEEIDKKGSAAKETANLWKSIQSYLHIIIQA